MKTRFEPRLHISILVPFRTTKKKDSFLPVTLLVWQICSLNWDLYINNFVGSACIWLWWSNVKILTTVAESRVQILGVNFNIFFHADILGRLGSNLVS
jgi:hypothetical protein